MTLLYPIARLALLSLLAVQSSTPPVRFDAVAIRENRSGQPRGGLEIPPQSDRILVTNASMERILAFAFDRARNDLIEGTPEWTRAERWDIDAKIADEDRPAFNKLPFAQQKLLLQSVLVERCHLRAHIAPKLAPVYALVIAKGGSKLHASALPESQLPPTWHITQKPGEIHGHAVPVAALLYALTNASLDRQVVDQTGLNGRYDFDLIWTPQDTAEAANSQFPSLFTAIQEQLGLQLKPTRAPVDALVVDHIERPTAN